MILDLERARDSSACGNKAVNLGRMLRRGLPVPPGIVVPRQALEDWLEESGLRPELDRLLSGAETGSAARRAARHVGRLFESTPLHDSLAAALDDAARELLAGAPPETTLAVRSSAAGEDGAARSWAGQLESRLGVEREGLSAAVRGCWAALWSSRARAYRGRGGDEGGGGADGDGSDQDSPMGPSMALVVQRLVPADAAGVLFTADPRTGERDLWVEAAWGLGTTVVDGRCTPDRWRLGRASGRVLESAVGEKSVELRPGNAAGPVAVPEDRRRLPALDSPQLSTLWRLALEVEAELGSPLDLEWAREGDRLFLLQARPLILAAR